MKAILSALCLSLIAHTVSAANSVPKAPVDGQTDSRITRQCTLVRRNDSSVVEEPRTCHCPVPYGPRLTLAVGFSIKSTSRQGLRDGGCVIAAKHLSTNKLALGFCSRSVTVVLSRFAFSSKEACHGPHRKPIHHEANSKAS